MDLPSLIGLGKAVEDRSLQAATQSLRRIGRALRHERTLAGSGRGGYDPARHLALMKAYRCELSIALRARSGEPRN